MGALDAAPPAASEVELSTPQKFPASQKDADASSDTSVSIECSEDTRPAKWGWFCGFLRFAGSGLLAAVSFLDPGKCNPAAARICCLPGTVLPLLSKHTHCNWHFSACTCGHQGPGQHIQPAFYQFLRAMSWLSNPRPPMRALHPCRQPGGRYPDGEYFFSQPRSRSPQPCTAAQASMQHASPCTE